MVHLSFFEAPTIELRTLLRLLRAQTSSYVGYFAGQNTLYIIIVE